MVLVLSRRCPSTNKAREGNCLRQVPQRTRPVGEHSVSQSSGVSSFTLALNTSNVQNSGWPSRWSPFCEHIGRSMFLFWYRVRTSVVEHEHKILKWKQLSRSSKDEQCFGVGEGWRKETILWGRIDWRSGSSFLNNSKVIEAVKGGHLRSNPVNSRNPVSEESILYFSSKTSNVAAIPARAVSCVLWTRILVGSEFPKSDLCPIFRVISESRGPIASRRTSSVLSMKGVNLSTTSQVHFRIGRLTSYIVRLETLHKFRLYKL